MNEFLEFLSMGGKGAFVWSAYGICFVVMIAVLVTPIRQRKQLLNRLKKQSQIDELNKDEHSS